MPADDEAPDALGAIQAGIKMEKHSIPSEVGPGLVTAGAGTDGANLAPFNADQATKPAAPARPISASPPQARISITDLVSAAEQTEAVGPGEQTLPALGAAAAAMGRAANADGAVMASGKDSQPAGLPPFTDSASIDSAYSTDPGRLGAGDRRASGDVPTQAPALQTPGAQQSLPSLNQATANIPGLPRPPLNSAWSALRPAIHTQPLQGSARPGTHAQQLQSAYPSSTTPYGSYPQPPQAQGYPHPYGQQPPQTQNMQGYPPQQTQPYHPGYQTMPTYGAQHAPSYGQMGLPQQPQQPPSAASQGMPGYPAGPNPWHSAPTYRSEDLMAQQRQFVNSYPPYSPSYPPPPQQAPSHYGAPPQQANTWPGQGPPPQQYPPQPSYDSRAPAAPRSAPAIQPPSAPYPIPYSPRNSRTPNLGNIDESQQRFPCPVCSATFSTRPLLARHSRIHTTASLTYRCGVPGCDRVFRRVDNRKVHEEGHRRRLEKEAKSAAALQSALNGDGSGQNPGGMPLQQGGYPMPPSQHGGGPMPGRPY